MATREQVFYNSQMTSGDLLDWTDDQRRAALSELSTDTQRQHAQYFTPAAIAELMASMLAPRGGAYRLLDAGAGIGVLAAAGVARLASSSPRPTSLHVTAYEIDPALEPRLRAVLDNCATFAAEREVPFTFEIRSRDFLDHARDLLIDSNDRYDGVILNPPYGKIGTDSEPRIQARALGVEVPNLYAAFMAGAIRLARPGADFVAITPRSFCNGTYFKPFRRFMLGSAAIRRLHVFDARNEAFSEQTVLQENLVTHLAVGGKPEPVVVTAQAAPGASVRKRTVPYERIISPTDPERFIHVVPDPSSDLAASFMDALPCGLDDLEISVSTGPVVDFRAIDLLRADPDDGTVPLLYPSHLRDGIVAWASKNGKKLTSISEQGASARRLLVPDGHYVLVKRFTAKEERRRVVAALYAGDPSSSHRVAIENHLNYLHARGRPLGRDLAIGLVVYLNSSHVDDYLRQFSGHTQVNAGDLRSLRYPTVDVLATVGANANLASLSDPAYFDRVSPIAPVSPDPDTLLGTSRLHQPVG